MEKIVQEGLLYDYYGALLTDHQRKVYEMTVYEDLSLNEIAQDTGVSKQAVHDLLKRTTAQLQQYEDKLHLVEKSAKLKKLAGKLEKILSEAGVESEGKAGGSEDTKIVVSGMELSDLLKRLKEESL